LYTKSSLASLVKTNIPSQKCVMLQQFKLTYVIVNIFSGSHITLGANNTVPSNNTFSSPPIAMLMMKACERESQ